MKILICGGGALGSHVLFLARGLAREHEFAVVDFDRVETRNLASQWFVKHMVGKPKATALKMEWLNFYGLKLGDFNVELTGLNAETILGGFDLLVDCFDNAKARGLVQDHAREHGMACLHGGLAADGEFAAVRWDRDFVIDAEDVPGQPTCDGDGFLPIILSTAGAIVTSLEVFLGEDAMSLNWNVTARGAESFEGSR